MESKLPQDSQEGRSHHQGRMLTHTPSSQVQMQWNVCFLIIGLIPQRYKQVTCASKDLGDYQVPAAHLGCSSGAEAWVPVQVSWLLALVFFSIHSLVLTTVLQTVGQKQLAKV